MIRTLVVAALWLAAPSAWAQGNYRSAALGGRSALMGDTGVALGTDGAAPFLNPATVVRVESTLALSVTFVSLDVLHASNWYTPGPVDPSYGAVPMAGTDIVRVSGNAIPSTLCLFAGLPKLSSDDTSHKGEEQLAACLGTTEIQQFDWVGQGYQPPAGTSATAQASSVRYAFQRFVFAPTYAVHLTDGLAIGASIQGVFTNFGASSSAGDITSVGAAAATSSSYQTGSSGSDFGLNAMLGATLTFDRLTIGASVQSPDVTMYGHGNVSSFVQFPSGAAQTATTYLGQGGFHAREPARMSLGVGYEWAHGSVELDGQLALADGHALELDAQGTQVPGGSQAVTLNTRYQPTVNVSVGAELYVRRSLSFLFGFATDFSAVDGLGAGALAPTQINRLLGSFGIGTHGESGTLLLGTQAYWGWGQAMAPNVYAIPPGEAATNVNTFGILFVLAGATSLKSIEEAAREMRNLVTRPPRGNPPP